jgi:uncharacterized protein (TIRG00374 family)
LNLRFFFIPARIQYALSRRMKKWLPLLLQSLVSVALLGWIFWQPEFRAQVWLVVTSADPAWLAAGFAVAGVGNLLGVIRWAVFLRVMQIPLPAWEILRLSFVGLFFNNFLVGAVGGDAVKVVWLAAKGYPKTPALLSVLMDRMSGLGALVLCSLTFMLWRLDWLMASPVVAGVIKFVFGYLAVVILLMAFSFVISARGLTSRLPARLPGLKMILEFTSAYIQFVAAWRATLAASTISLVILLAYFATFYCSARAFGVDIPALDFFAFMPAVDIISALPVSLGGFGVRDKLFAILLGDLSGVPMAQAVSVSLGGAVLSLIWGLFGLALLPSYRQAVRS